MRREQELRLESCEMPDGLDGLAVLPQCRALDLRWTQHPDCSKLLRAAGRSLTRLNLRVRPAPAPGSSPARVCWRATTEGQRAVVQGCEWVTAHCVLQTNLCSLREVDVSYTPSGDPTLAALEQASCLPCTPAMQPWPPPAWAPHAGCTGNCAHASAQPAGLSVQGCPELEELRISSKQFNLWFCGSWTEAGLAAFQAARPAVRLVTGT